MLPKRSDFRRGGAEKNEIVLGRQWKHSVIHHMVNLSTEHPSTGLIKMVARLDNVAGRDKYVAQGLLIPEEPELRRMTLSWVGTGSIAPYIRWRI